jgi:rhamnosyltransferase subunit B
VARAPAGSRSLVAALVAALHRQAMTTAAAPPVRVCLVTLGSAGDVHPMLALGQGLQSRGHAVTLMANPAWAELVQRTGLDFEPVGDPADSRATVAHPKLWHPIDGFGVMWRYLLRPALAPTYQRLAALAEEGRCVVIANPVAMGARLAQEKLGLPLITAYTAATMLRTVHDPMTLAPWRVPPWMPRSLRRAAWSLLDRYKLEPLVRPALDALRREIGLPPQTESVFGRWMHSPQAGVTLFPQWFAAAPPDWPPQVVQGGFTLYEGDAQAVPPEVRAFIEQGAAPVVFMPGTAAQAAAPFFAAAVQACRATGQRGLLLGAVPQALKAQLPNSMLAADYAPFAWLLPRARALVHHGGIGSCAQALRAGIAQLVVPQAYDQFDNAMRLERLGVGLTLPGSPAGLQAMGTALGRLLSEPRFAYACMECAPLARPEAAQAALAGLVERFS